MSDFDLADALDGSSRGTLMLSRGAARLVTSSRELFSVCWSKLQEALSSFWTSVRGQIPFRHLFVDDKVPGTDCCNGTKDDQKDTIRLREGLDLVVSRDPKSLQCTATLLAVARMKRPLYRNGRALSGSERCSSILQSVVEETILKTTANFTKFQTFMRADSAPQLLALCDLEQKSFVLDNEMMKLLSVTLRGGHEDCKVYIHMKRYETVTAQSGLPVLLSINKYNLSCSMDGVEAKLILEPCPQQDLSNISQGAGMDRFLFWKKIGQEGPNLSTYESISCPGWFISTSSEVENEPVAMCKVDCTRNKSFLALPKD
ncbi:interleukin-1 beta [Notolabrus celidotus]|uniref:interleukin-1 beta n=1 Tax=Notolabrus celidotus TaxID=1203425 RepID=UPI0014906DF6|nr:interleukin-1 beta [Notolabrus celidotus]XP_034565729.1 interleukin-1 beta [Notolabrus celidotus]